MAATPAIDITLRCSDKLDEYTTRTFTLRPGAKVQIGRASKNAAKPELMVGPGNAFIDSPTISREHAVLTVAPPPDGCVYITDQASMHGTMVNGNRLDPQKAQRLNNGDVLQFGANVTREQLFYTARQFTFESSLPSYPNGFTVPESSDEEDVEVDDDLSCPPSYGTQKNPLTIDIDNDDGSHLVDVEKVEVPAVRADVSNDDEFDDDELDRHLQDSTISLEASHDPQERSPSPDDDEPVFYPEDLSNAYPNKYAFVDDASSEGDAASIYSSEDEQQSQLGNYSCASADSDESQSDGDMELAEEDDEEEQNEVDVPSFEMQLRLLEQQNKQRLLMARQEQDSQQAASEVRPVPSEPKEVLGSASTTVDAFRSDSSELGLTAPPAPPTPFENARHAALPSAECEVPKLPDMYFTSNSVFSDSYNRALLDSMDALPPRPAAPRPMWPSMVDYASPFSPPANAPNFPAPYPPDFVGTYSGPAEPLLGNPYAAPQPYSSPVENPWEQSKGSAGVAIPGVQTPPPAPSSELESPPVRRTEVSIREIVEDVMQQPPTPTSVSGGVKRKADVLDEVVEEAPISTEQVPMGAATPDAVVVEAVNAVDQRPKKRPRSMLTKAASYVASGLVGAAGAVVLLTSVPNDFFVA